MDCQNCTCLNSIPVCHRIQCKYEPCGAGNVFVLNEDKCCPTCQSPMKPCQYDNYLIEVTTLTYHQKPLVNLELTKYLFFFFKHNTDFSPKLCETCKCKNGLIECVDNCVEKSRSHEAPSDDKKQRLDRHHHRHRVRNEHTQPAPHALNGTEYAKTPCVHENKVYAFQAVWSPLRCTQCKCGYNSVADCYVKECPSLANCTNVSLIRFFCRFILYKWF